MQGKFYLNKLEHYKNLKALLSVVKTSPLIQELGCIHVESGEKLKFTGTDLESVVVLSFVPDSLQEYSVLVPGSAVKSVLSSQLDDPIEFDILAKDKLCITQGNFKLKTILGNPDMFPKVPYFEGSKFTVDGSKIGAAIKDALQFVSKDDLRPAMTGVFIQDLNGHLTVVSTDAHRLYYKKVCPTPSGAEGIAAIMPMSSAKLFLQVFFGGTLKVKFDKMHISFTQVTAEPLESKKLLCRQIQATYPSWTSVINSYDLDIYFKRKQLTQLLKLGLKHVSRATYQVKVEVDGGSAKISAEDVDFSESFSFSVGVYNPNLEFPSFTFAVNAKFLLEALSVNSKEEYVKLNHSTTELKSMNIDDCILLMPLMLNK
jgi:DNA polymerase-3 subunit beta